MIPCPFSRDRLEELVWEEHWRPSQIATLAQAILCEPVDEAQVRAWMQEAGVSPREPRAPAAAPPPPRMKPAPKRREKRPGEGTITVPCEVCETLVTRVPSEIGEHVLCCHACIGAWNRVQAEAERVKRREAAQDPETQKVCPECPEGQGLKLLTEFAVDRSRADGRARVCRECNRRKSQAYYQANRERVIERVQLNKRKRGAGS